MVDNSNLKIQLFQGINDNPSPPTEFEAGNGSHLIAQFNALIESYDTTIQALQTQVTELSTVKDSLTSLQIQTSETETSLNALSNQVTIVDNTLSSLVTSVDVNKTNTNNALGETQNQVRDLLTSVNNLSSRVSTLENASNSSNTTNPIIIEGINLPQYEYTSVYTTTEQISVSRIKIKNFTEGYQFFWGLRSRALNGVFEVSADSVDYVFATPEVVEANQIFDLANEGVSQTNLSIEIVLA